MQLVVCDGEAYDDVKVVEPGVDDNFIEQRLKDLFEKDSDGSFAILTDQDKEPGNEEFYIQAVYMCTEQMGEGDNGFVLEYRDGSGDKHYQCFNVSPGLQGLEDVTKAFIDYLHSNEEWKTPFEWETLNLV